jgi:hypothetical protein
MANEWIVELAISGPITTKAHLQLVVQKGENFPFMTFVKIRNAEHGISAELIARADNPDDASDAALYFVGQMLDVMCLRINLPIYLSHVELKFRPINKNVKRIITEDELNEYFRLGREYGMNRKTFGRALSWYRKAKTSEDSIDKFLGFWSSIEAVCSKYARENERTSKGIINKICDCFDQLWESMENWKVIPSGVEWVKKFQNMRNGIAHGLITVNIDNLKEIVNHLGTLESLAYEFLKEWEIRRLDVQ